MADTAISTATGEHMNRREFLEHASALAVGGAVMSVATPDKPVEVAPLAPHLGFGYTGVLLWVIQVHSPAEGRIDRFYVMYKGRTIVAVDDFSTSIGPRLPAGWDRQPFDVMPAVTVRGGEKMYEIGSAEWLRTPISVHIDRTHTRSAFSALAIRECLIHCGGMHDKSDLTLWPQIAQDDEFGVLLASMWREVSRPNYRWDVSQYAADLARGCHTVTVDLDTAAGCERAQDHLHLSPLVAAHYHVLTNAREAICP